MPWPARVWNPAIGASMTADTYRKIIYGQGHQRVCRQQPCMGLGHIREWGLTWEKHFRKGALRTARRAAPRPLVATRTGDGSDARHEAAFWRRSPGWQLGSNGLRDFFPQPAAQGRPIDSRCSSSSPAPQHPRPGWPRHRRLRPSRFHLAGCSLGAGLLLLAVTELHSSSPRRARELQRMCLPLGLPCLASRWRVRVFRSSWSALSSFFWTFNKQTDKDYYDCHLSPPLRYNQRCVTHISLKNVLGPGGIIREIAIGINPCSVISTNQPILLTRVPQNSPEAVRKLDALSVGSLLYIYWLVFCNREIVNIIFVRSMNYNE